MKRFKRSQIFRIFLLSALIYPWPNATAQSWSIMGRIPSGTTESYSSGGENVALSADGKRIATISCSEQIRKYVLRVLEWNGNQWVQCGRDIDSFNIGNFSIALSADGKSIAVGIGGGNAVIVYAWNSSKSLWNSMGSIITGESGFGWSISFSGDGSRLAIGIPFSKDQFGSVQVYSWNSQSASWNLLGGTLGAKSSQDWFGQCVSLSADGERLAILAGRGAYVRVFSWNRVSGSWVQLGSDLDSVYQLLDIYTFSIALSADGNRLAIGAPTNTVDSLYDGQVRVFEWNNTQASWNRMGDYLKGQRTENYFGSAVSLSANGKKMAVLASGNRQILLYTWKTADSKWTMMQGDTIPASFNSRISLSADGSQLAIGEPMASNMENAIRVYKHESGARRGRSILRCVKP